MPVESDKIMEYMARLQLMIELLTPIILHVLEDCPEYGYHYEIMKEKFAALAWTIQQTTKERQQSEAYGEDTQEAANDALRCFKRNEKKWPNWIEGYPGKLIRIKVEPQKLPKRGSSHSTARSRKNIFGIKGKAK